MSGCSTAIRTISIVLGLAAVVFGCSPLPTSAVRSERFVLDIKKQRHAVEFELGSVVMNSKERADLNTFAAGLEPAEQSTITLRASDIRADERIARIANVFADKDIDLRRDDGDVPFGRVAVDVRQEIVRPGACPRPDETDHRLGGDTPIGCLNDYALFDMVEERRDLVRGRSPGLAPSAPAAALARALDGNGLVLRDTRFRSGSLRSDSLAKSESLGLETDEMLKIFMADRDGAED